MHSHGSPALKSLRRCLVIRGNSWHQQKAPCSHTLTACGIPFAKSLENHISQCYEIVITHYGEVGCPANGLYFKVSIRVSLNLDMRSFSYGNMSLTLNQVRSAVSHSTLSTAPGISLTLPVWEHFLRASAGKCARVCVITHYGIKEWPRGSKIECETIALRMEKASVSDVRRILRRIWL